ncbi:MAG: cytochrome P460 family protein [Myxococcota bacterium]
MPFAYGAQPCAARMDVGPIFVHNPSGDPGCGVLYGELIMHALRVFVGLALAWGLGCTSGEPRPTAEPIETEVVAPNINAASKPPKPNAPSPELFESWPAATSQAVSVSPTLWMLCRAPTEADIAQRRESLKKIYGPHANYAIVVRVNPKAIDAFKRGESLAQGSTVIKEKHADSGTGVTFPADPPRRPVEYAWMSKRATGWEYGYVSADGEVSAGALEQCAGCHAGAKGSDYLFRGYLSAE